MADGWEAFKFLPGEWAGGNTGDPGQGQGKFSFNFELDQNILVRKSHTEYPATGERAPMIHEDLMIIYDEVAGGKRAIYFDNEGHVIHYEVEAAQDQKMITLLSDPAPSAPQFRFTYQLTGEDQMQAKFEIAPPGNENFSVYVEGTVRRVR